MTAMEETCFPISEISAYVQRWTIRGRVTNKSQLRSFARSGSGGGKVFHVHILDVHGGEIRASFFGDAAEKYSELLQLGKCYTFSRGNVKVANPQFNPCNHRYEITFDKLAQVDEAADDERIETVKLNLTDLRSVQSRALPCNVDLCGVITAAGPCTHFTSRDGKELVQRRVTLADDSSLTMEVTLWGAQAKKEDKHFEGQPVVCMKGVAVKEWNGGRSGSLSEGGALVFQPTVPAAQRLQQWWREADRTQGLTPLSAAFGGGSSRLASARHMDLAELRKASEQLGHQPELYVVVARLALVQLQKRGETQPLTYTACQELREGRSLPCNKRVDASGFCAGCNKAGKAAARYNLRCRFADFVDNAWLTTFHEAAQQVLGMSAEQAQALEQGEGGREALEAAIARRYFALPLQLTLRAKLDTFNGETRTNVTCIDARPAPRGERGRAMLKEIHEMLAATPDQGVL